LDYDTLVAQHEAIDAATQVLLALSVKTVPRPVEAASMLSVLAVLVRDHLSAEDPVIYETVAVTCGTRHGEAAALSAREFERLKHDWTDYLRRWTAPAIAANWVGFVEESHGMLGRLRERVMRETAILYSLAHHYEVVGDGSSR
jgi:hypothetical protein